MDGTVEGIQLEAEKIAKRQNKTPQQVIQDTARSLSEGKLEKDVGTIEAAETRGGYAAASYKSGVEIGAGTGAAYDNMQTLVGGDSKHIAQTLKNRTSMTDTRKHLLEDIATFGLDKVNKTMGTDFNSDLSAAEAMLATGLGITEFTQLMRGGKSPTKAFVNNMKDTLSGNNSKTDKQTPHGSNNGENSDKVNNKNTQHDNPHKTNFAGQPTSNHPSIIAQNERNSKLGSLKSVGGDLVKGLVVGTALDEATQFAVDGGNFRTANVLQAGVNAMKGVGTAALGGVATVFGGVDEAINAVTGVKPFGSLAAYSTLTKNDNLFQTGVKMVDEASTSVAEGMLNIQDGYNGSKNVIGRSKGANTALGNLTGYGSIAQHTGSVSLPTIPTSISPAGGSGQLPGGSQFTANSSVPAHAQAAFSAPPNYNTMQAMNPKNTYNDTTSTLNSTPNEYKADHSEDSFRKLDDISMGIDGVQDQTA